MSDSTPLSQFLKWEKEIPSQIFLRQPFNGVWKTWSYQEAANEIRRIDIIFRVANVFAEVLAAQERLRLAEETKQVAQNVVSTVTERVQGGKVPPIEETRVKVGLSTTRIELEQAQRDLAGARKRLALLWNSASPQFNKALGNLETLIAPPNFKMLEERVLSNPMALRAMKNIEQRKAFFSDDGSGSLMTKRDDNLPSNQADGSLEKKRIAHL